MDSGFRRWRGDCSRLMLGRYQPYTTSSDGIGCGLAFDVEQMIRVRPTHHAPIDCWRVVATSVDPSELPHWLVRGRVRYRYLAAPGSPGKRSLGRSLRYIARVLCLAAGQQYQLRFSLLTPTDQLATLHTRTVASALADTSFLPSGENPAQFTKLA